MNGIGLSNIKNILEYEREREGFRDRIIEIKKARRIGVGDLFSFVFENRDTVLFQIQEMVRAERIIDEGKIQEEIDSYAELLPGPRTLSATMFIELQEQATIRQTLEKFLGITGVGIVRLEIGDRHIVNAHFEGGREEEESGRVSAVQYGKFPMDQQAFEGFMNGSAPVYLVIDHPNYKARAHLSETNLEALRSDLRQAA
jgi:hypothetical protein